jgi:hypothetical protein
MKRSLNSAFACVAMIWSSLGFAQQSQSLVAVPTAWRLENYVTDAVVIWSSGSSCAGGQLIFPANASNADRNRLWSVVSIGKVANKKVFVYYIPVNASTCHIYSFGLLEE